MIYSFAPFPVKRTRTSMPSGEEASLNDDIPEFLPPMPIQSKRVVAFNPEARESDSAIPNSGQVQTALSNLEQSVASR